MTGWIGRAGAGFTGHGLTGMITCNLDGVTRLRSYIPGAFGITQMEMDDITNKVLVAYTSSPYLFNPVVCGRDPTDAFESGMDTAYIRTKVGWYRTSGNNVQIAPLDAADETEFVTEYVFVPVSGLSSNARFSLGPDNLLYFYTDNADGDIIAYDYVLKTEVFPNTTNTERWALGGQVDACFYSRKLDVFVTYEDIGGDIGELNVYSLELSPSALSAPTASPAITAGVVSTISVTLTDSEGIGIVGRLIDWSITAGDGTILDPQTTTDADGIATTQYRAEISGGSDPTIEASLTY